MNRLTDRDTEGPLHMWTRAARYGVKLFTGVVFIALAYWLHPHPLGAAAISLAAYVVWTVGYAAQHDALTPVSGFFTWHGLVKLPLHCMPMPVLWLRSEPLVAVSAVGLLVAVWWYAWPRDAG